MKTFTPWLLFAGLLLAAPLVWTSGFAHSLLSQMGIAIVACLSFQLLYGQGGMLSFGHAVYTGMGAYLAIHTLNLAAAQGWPLPVSLLPLAAGLGVALLALPLGWISTRKSGTPFAMITLGVGELVWAFALMFPGFSGGDAGMTGNRVTGSGAWGITFGPAIQLYYLIAAYTIATLLLVWGFSRTTLGRLLNAVRDNPLRVPFVGYDVQVVRYVAFVLAAFVAGVSGGLAALLFEIVTPEVLGTTRSGALLLFTVLGGSALLAGPVVGGVMMVLALVSLSALTPAWLLYMGLLFMLVVMRAPDGVAGWAQRSWNALRQGQAGRITTAPGLWAARCLAAGFGLAALALLVEMAYHHQLSATLGSVWQLGPLALDTAQPGPWVAAAAAAVMAGAVWHGLGRFKGHAR